MTIKSSNLWADITSSLFQNIDNDFINSFRKPGGANARLAAWDPYDKSMRYYKFLLYNSACAKNQTFFEAYKKIKNVNIGQPVSVNIGGCNINIDHLFAVEEVLFIQDTLKNEIKSVVEIGAGFGRTCQALLCIEPTIEIYTIIDLPEVLNLSKAYLRNAIPEFFHKIEFIDCNSDFFKDRAADLAINIDSFQEMMPATIDKYMKDVISNCHAFYSKNPTGKYSPSNVGLQNVKPEQLIDVYSLGYCREVFDLFNEAALDRAAKNYLAAYLPPSDFGALGTWRLVADQAMAMFPQYHHALYLRS
jgi:putative sugar O-methyltransferase